MSLFYVLSVVKKMKVFRVHLGPTRLQKSRPGPTRFEYPGLEICEVVEGSGLYVCSDFEGMGVFFAVFSKIWAYNFTMISKVRA